MNRIEFTPDLPKAKRIEIILPPEIAHYEGEFRYFVDSMVRKLHANRHKGFVEGLDFVACLDGIQGEIAELETSKSQFEAFMEAVDIANWGFLTAVFLGRMTRPEFDTINGDHKKPKPKHAGLGHKDVHVSHNCDGSVDVYIPSKARHRLPVVLAALDQANKLYNYEPTGATNDNGEMLYVKKEIK